MLPPEHNDGFITKASAIIRQQFGIDAATLTDEEFADLYTQALWLKELDVELMETAVLKALAKIFAK